MTSSNIAKMGYGPGTSTREIKFHNGGAYQYANIPSEIHNELMKTASKGSYFSRHIKKHYFTTKIK